MFCFRWWQSIIHAYVHLHNQKGRRYPSLLTWRYKSSQVPQSYHLNLLSSIWLYSVSVFFFNTLSNRRGKKTMRSPCSVYLVWPLYFCSSIPDKLARSIKILQRKRERERGNGNDNKSRAGSHLSASGGREDILRKLRSQRYDRLWFRNFLTYQREIRTN